VGNLSIDFPFLVLLTGVIIVMTTVIKPGLEMTGVPHLVGYLAVGFLLRLTDGYFHFLAPGSLGIFDFLAKTGLIVLLFRVGLESNLKGLMGQLRRASIVWIGDVLLSGALGYLTAYYLLNLGWVTSLFIATAFTATSVGISVAVWDDAGALTSPTGELMLDVAELDDISAVILMALLFAILPQLQLGADSDLVGTITKTLVTFTIKLVLFGAFCYLFSRYVEPSFSWFFRRLEKKSSFMVPIVGLGFVIASMAEMMGFSLAIGAFFAGLVFSRDPEAVKKEGTFLPIYELFSPFFFIGIGLDMNPDSLVSAIELGGVLLAAAAVGKILADGLPVWAIGGFPTAALIGLSMVPRAEICMVIMQRGQSLGDWAVSSEVFSAMVLVSAATCIGAPMLVRNLLDKWPQKNKGS
jgi:Kef-type K+ transport system membrane component KefB